MTLQNVTHKNNLSSHLYTPPQVLAGYHFQDSEQKNYTRQVLAEVIAISSPHFHIAKEYDVLIIGAGAAGLMAAIAAARRGARVLVLDGAKKVGAKILVSGGNRCNVTNECIHPNRFHTESDPNPDAANRGDGRGSFVGRVLRAFNARATHAFFESIGVALKLEPTGKYFPVSDSSRTVLNALLQELNDSGAVLKTSARAQKIAHHEDHWQVTIEDPNGTASTCTYSARALILCCGGKALPKTGSDGSGYNFALQWGHTLIRTTPALTPLLAQPQTHAHLSGIALPVRLALQHENQTLATRDGSFLFTHVGYSGPVALDLSRHVARQRWQYPDAIVKVRWLPQIEIQDEGRWWQELVRTGAKKTFAVALQAHFPNRVAQTFAQNFPDTALGRFDAPTQKRAREVLFSCALPVHEIDNYTRAEATAGGIALSEIEPATMESKLKAGLFLAGEICDVDGWLGGYNFQWAWSSGVVAGRAAAKLALSQ